MYPITNPNTREVFFPAQGNCWKNDLHRFNDLLADNRIVFGRSGKARPQRKRFLSEAKDRGLTPNTWWDDVGTTTSGTNLLNKLLESSNFPNPKPITLVYRILQLGTDKDSIILDSFAGSGTTAHAVLALNKEDGGDRKFILVECEDYADTVTAERVRRVIEGVTGARDGSLREGLGGSFTYCTLGEPIELEGMLTGAALPSYTTLAAYLLHAATGVSAGESSLQQQNDDGLFFFDEKADYYLLYESSTEWLSSSMAVLNEERAQRISAASHAHGRKAVVFAAGKYIGQRELTDMGITFCQLPYEMHRTGE